MDTSTNMSIAQTAAALSVIKSANRQPELALQLMLKSLAATQPATQIPAVEIPGPADAQGTGQIIDIIA